MADALEAVRQHMTQEAAQKVLVRQAHDFFLVSLTAAGRAIAKAHGVRIELQQTLIADSDPMGVAG